MIVSKLEQAKKIIDNWRHDCEFCGQNSKGTWYYFSGNCSLHCLNTNELGMIGTPVKTWFGWGYTKEMIENIIEQEKPRTKTVYKPMRGLAVSEAFKAMEDDGDVYVNCCDGSFEAMDGRIINLANAIHDGSVIYRKVEKEIDWKDDLDHYIRHDTNIDIRDSIANAHKDFPEQFIGMCHLVASLTDKPE